MMAQRAPAQAQAQTGSARAKERAIMMSMSRTKQGIGAAPALCGTLLLCGALGLLLSGCSSHVQGVDSDADTRPPQPDLSGHGEPMPDLAGWAYDFYSPPRDLTAGPDLSGKPPGATCGSDGECMSGACKPVGSGGGSICVAPCHMQADCAALPGGLFCEPKAAGSSDGYCIPPSPAHCASCTMDSDCGVLAEHCSTAPGDVAPACHVDCSLSSAACPSDYECDDVTEAGPMGTMTHRKLCLPKTKVCLDSLGGFCDRVALPQSCARTNDAGSCTGQRPCLAGGRFDKCGATAPQYKHCGDMDPPGCMLKLAPDAIGNKLNCGACFHACAADEDCCSNACKKLNTATDCGSCGKTCGAGSGCCAGACTALNTVQNCGGCGNVCDGQGLSTNDVFCDAMTLTCGMTCRGDNYDVDTKAANGCEVADAVPPGHSQPTAASRGSKSCSDTASRDTFNAGVTSDQRVHKNPAVDSFNGTVGAAPDWWIIHADGGFLCEDDYSVTLTTMGGSTSSCYTATFISNKTTDSVTVNGSSWGTMSGGSGSYSDGSDIYIKVEKTCSSPAPEKVSYQVDYHL
jgi:hypothetical protein